MVIPDVADHDAMLMDIEAIGVCDIRPNWNNKRNIIIDHGDPRSSI